MKRNPIQDIVRVNNKISVVKDKKSTKKTEQYTEPVEEKTFEEKLSKKKFLEQDSYSQDDEEVSTIKIKKEGKVAKASPAHHVHTEPPHINNKITKRKSHNKKLPIFIFLSLAFVGLLYILSVVFAHATLYVHNKVQHFTFADEAFNMQRNPSSALHFEIMIVDGTESKEMTFTETKELSTKARGEVVIYNAYSKTPVKLLINTRLEDDTKNIYMTDKAVTIPGFTMSGSKVVPGSVVVGITAQNPGDKYNGDPRDFVIFGYKGTAKATKIYARSKTSLSGGATGNVYTPSATEKGTISTDIGVLLRNKLEKKLQAQVPEGYIFYPGSAQFALDLNSDNLTSKTSTAKIEASATLSAVLIKSDDLQKAIIKAVYANVGDDEISEIQVPDMQKLIFAYKNPNEIINKSTSNIDFTLSGDGDLVWNPDLDKLHTTVIGMKVDQLDQIFKADPGIENVRVILRPPWQKNLPKKANYISIKRE